MTRARHAAPPRPVATVVGVDGCALGWVAIRLRVDRVALAVEDAAALPTVHELFAWADDAHAIGIDIPIGLLHAAEPGGRPADRAARQLLKHRASSVFSAPIRPVLDAKSYPEALAASRGSSPHALGLSKQTYNITPKIREVDHALRADADTPARVHECHPELSFAAMPVAPDADTALWQPCLHRKATPEGRAERLARLAAVGLAETPTLLTTLKRPGVKPDDIIDAHACAWSMARHLRQQSTRIAGTADRDQFGLPIAIIV